MDEANDKSEEELRLLFLERKWSRNGSAGGAETDRQSAGPAPLHVGSSRNSKIAAAILITAGLTGLAGGIGYLLTDPQTEASPLQTESVSIQPASGAQWRWSDDRQSVTLESGRVRFDVRPGGEGFRVETPVGGVRVLGTRFEVHSFSPPAPWDQRRKLSVSRVAVEEGGVRIFNPSGERDVFYGNVGYLVSNESPFLHQASSGNGTPEAFLATLKQAFEGENRTEALRAWVILCGEGRLWVPAARSVLEREELRETDRDRVMRFLNAVGEE